MTRKEQTTDHLRDVACDLLLRHGSRAFTQEALAREGFASIGSIYSRWPSKTQTLLDIADSRVLPSLERIADLDPEEGPWTALRHLLDDPSGRRSLQMAVEIMLAARDDEVFLPHANELRRRIETIARFPEEGPDEGLTWWLTSLAVGWGLILTGQLEPAPVTEAIWSVLVLQGAPHADTRASSAPVALITPPSPAAPDTDAKGTAAKRSVRELLATRPASEINTKTIVESSQMSIAALYRRFPTRSELLRSILIDELQSDRYSWSKDLIEAATVDRAVDAVVDIIVEALKRVCRRGDEQSLILELTVAARIDSALRQQLTSQIDASVNARTQLFDQLGAAGFFSTAITGEQLAWAFQAPPIGARLLASLGWQPDDTQIRQAVRRVCGAVMITDD